LELVTEERLDQRFLQGSDGKFFERWRQKAADHDRPLMYWQWNPQQLPLIGHPDFSSGTINLFIIIAEIILNPRQAEG